MIPGLVRRGHGLTSPAPVPCEVIVDLEGAVPQRCGMDAVCLATGACVHEHICEDYPMCAFCVAGGRAGEMKCSDCHEAGYVVDVILVEVRELGADGAAVRA